MDKENEPVTVIRVSAVKMILLAAAGMLAAAVFISMGIGYLIGSGYLKLW